MWIFVFDFTRELVDPILPTATTTSHDIDFDRELNLHLTPLPSTPRLWLCKDELLGFISVRESDILYPESAALVNDGICSGTTWHNFKFKMCFVCPSNGHSNCLHNQSLDIGFSFHAFFVIGSSPLCTQNATK